MLEVSGRRRTAERSCALERHNIDCVAGEVAAVGQPAVFGRRRARSPARCRDRRARRYVAHRAQTARRSRGRASLPSASSVMRSCGRAGATVIGVAGTSRPARANSQPAASVSASGTATAKRPATPRTAKPSARLAPEPPRCSGTQASGSPALLSASHSGAFHAPFVDWLMLCGSARSTRIRSAASATIWLPSPATSVAGLRSAVDGNWRCRRELPMRPWWSLAEALASWRIVSGRGARMSEVP